MSESAKKQYVDARTFLPEFKRYDCWQCGHGWVKDEGDDPSYGRCPDCGWTQDENYMAKHYGVTKEFRDRSIVYLDVETGEEVCI